MRGLGDERELIGQHGAEQIAIDRHLCCRYRGQGDALIGLVGLVTRRKNPHVGHREERFRTLDVHKTEPLSAGERRFAMRACDVPQRGPRHLRELLRSEHGEATEAEDTDADRVR